MDCRQAKSKIECVEKATKYCDKEHTRDIKKELGEVIAEVDEVCHSRVDSCMFNLEYAGTVMRIIKLNLFLVSVRFR